MTNHHPIQLPNGRKIADDQPCFIVAEIGQNHQGDTYTATRLMKVAHDAGVDAVKFCKRHIPSDMTAAMRQQPYDNPNAFGKTYGEHRESLELSTLDYKHLKARAIYNEWKPILFATACDRQSVDDIEEALNPPLYKIASRDLDNLPLIDYVARLDKPVILSTGMARGQEITQAVEAVLKHHTQLVVMYCISEYPTPDEHIRLRCITELQTRLGVLIGFSDHSIGIAMAPAAVCVGAVVVEKHITLARAMKGTDHACSLEPQGLAKYVRNIRLTEAALGPPEFGNGWLSDVLENRLKLGRSLVSSTGIHQGETITEEKLCLKSPGTGISWSERYRVVGKRATAYIPRDMTVRASDVGEVNGTCADH